jgi:serine/threonine protein phosphatase PrpC
MNNLNNRIIQNQNNISMGIPIQNNNLPNAHFINNNNPNISNQLINNVPINQMVNQTQNSPRNFQQNQTIYNSQINPLLSQNQQLSNFIYQNKQIINSQQNQIMNQFQNNIQNQIQTNPNQPNTIQNQTLSKNQIINQSQLSSPQENEINNSINKLVSEKREINDEGDIKKDISVRYNSFDPSGWVKNYGVLTLPGKDTSGSQKTNQDSFVFKTGINQIKDFNIFGVLDGHGPEGHFVSKFTSEFLPSKLINHPEIKSLKNTEEIYRKLKDNNCYIITQAFIETDNQLKNVDFDAYESGCTCVLVIHIGSHIICANTGDSRSIVVYDEQGDNNLNHYNVAALSKDYKPELPEETQRIIMSGGEVKQMKNEMGEGVGPFRVWALDENYPGLAMSRSIGDLKGKKIGVIPDPGILEYDLCEKTKYIVACSDGVWEFLNNDEVKEIGKNYYAQNDPSGFCHSLIDQSLNLWETNDIVVDDITAVVAFF